MREGEIISLAHLDASVDTSLMLFMSNSKSFSGELYLLDSKICQYHSTDPLETGLSSSQLQGAPGTILLPPIPARGLTAAGQTDPPAVPLCL